MQDKIQREIIIMASQKKIFDAIANPEKVVRWFPNSIEGEYKVGKQPIFGFGENGKNQVYIVESRPYDYFAYRWVPGANHFLGDVLSVANTLVEFRIEELDEGKCKLTMSESGFSKLPAEVVNESFKQNTSGWEFMLGRLETYLSGE